MTLGQLIQLITPLVIIYFTYTTTKKKLGEPLWFIILLQFACIVVAFSIPASSGLPNPKAFGFLSCLILHFVAISRKPKNTNRKSKATKNESNSAYKSICPRCKYFDMNYGVCSYLHFNVESYPKQFVKKCNGRFFSEKTD